MLKICSECEYEFHENCVKFINVDTFLGKIFNGSKNCQCPKCSGFDE